MVSFEPIMMMTWMMWMFVSHSMCVTLMCKEMSMLVCFAASVSLVTVPRISDSSPIIAVSCAVVAVVFPLAIDSLASVRFDVS